MPNYFVVQTENNCCNGMHQNCHHHNCNCGRNCGTEDSTRRGDGGGQSRGELLTNPGFESFTVADIPDGWTITGTVERQTNTGQVHSGTSSLRLSGGSTVAQTVDVSDNSRRYYEFSFFANANGTGGPLTATVTFLPSCQTGLTIAIRSLDLPTGNGDFTYYRGITSQAPAGTNQVQVRFTYGTPGNDIVNIDDVSLSVD